MKFYTPKTSGSKFSLKSPKLSSHIIKPAKSPGKIAIKVPRFAGRGSKIGKVTL